MTENYGTERWGLLVSLKVKKENPWLEFRFPAATEVDRIRLSNNRENFFDTDYLTDLKPFNFPSYRIETQADDAHGWLLLSPKTHLNSTRRIHSEKTH